MLGKMRYRLALDLGTTSIGWCILRLDAQDAPCAVIRAGVRIFSDGRVAKSGESLAVTRRLARQMRRRRDRLLQRKAHMVDALVRLEFWPPDRAARQAFDAMDPYQLRCKGLDHALTPQEFGRALFHLNQRRGFKSNRSTDKGDDDTGLLKSAIGTLRSQLEDTHCRTVGEWLARRHESRQSVRARLRGTSQRDKAYDLYIDRAMVAAEFDALWGAQAQFEPQRYSEAARERLRHILLHQRPLKPVKAGRCTLIHTEERAPLALPSVQRFRMLQELNHLRLRNGTEPERALTLAERDKLADLLEQADLGITPVRKALGLGGRSVINLFDGKRSKLKGNHTGQRLAQEDAFGVAWHGFGSERQDEIVRQLVSEPDAERLVRWLQASAALSESRAEHVSEIHLAPGYGNVSLKAISLILPRLREAVMTYDQAVAAAGLGSHSALTYAEQTGEILDRLPYYGERLERHVGFADPKAKADDPPEKRFGRIANPTVHIGLNELRKVVNALIERYGHPSQVVVEVTRELKLSQARKLEELQRQKERQEQNERFANDIRSLPGKSDSRVSRRDLQRMRLWVELNPDAPLNRCCPYTGEQIGWEKLFSPQVEEEHILPFSQTLDDSMNNRTLSMRRANRDKGNRSPHEAFGHSPPGYDYAAILERTRQMPREKARRFEADGLEYALRGQEFLARALNDTSYLARIAREYLTCICPNQVWVVPGRLTSILRGLMGLNKVLSLTGEKNRDDHRHHAVDAAVIGVTDRSMLQRFARASASAREAGLEKLVQEFEPPWPTYRQRVADAVNRIVVSHRPDHGHAAALHNDTAYGLRDDGQVVVRKALNNFKNGTDLAKAPMVDSKLQQWLVEQTAGLKGMAFLQRLESIRASHGVRRVKVQEKLKVIPITEPGSERHGTLEDGSPKPYKGYDPNSNYCIEIWADARGRWVGRVMSTFAANQLVLEASRVDALTSATALSKLRHGSTTADGEPIKLRLCKNDVVRLVDRGEEKLMILAKIKSSTEMFFAEVHEANLRNRADDALDSFDYFTARPSRLQKCRARQVTVTPDGKVSDPGFTG